MELSLPTFDLPDGKKYSPPSEVVQAMHMLYSLAPQDYMNAMLYLAPMSFIVDVYRASQNPIMPSLHQQALMSRYWQYHAQVAGMQVSGSKSSPIPGSQVKQ